MQHLHAIRRLVFVLTGTLVVGAIGAPRLSADEKEYKARTGQVLLFHDTISTP